MSSETNKPPVSDTTVRKSYREQLEDDGYQTGLAGMELEQCPMWSEAWRGATGSNSPAFVIAGWIAGRAMWRFKKEAEKESSDAG